MKYISHRGNLNGPNKEIENTKEQIKKVIELGYDCEIDLWYIENDIFLGHDKPENIVSLDFLLKYKNNLWCHCKNHEMLEYLNINNFDLNYFWHQNDYYTITSKGYTWVYPGKQLIKNSIFVLPEYTNFSKNSILKNMNIGGICSDYILNYINLYF
jgi:hypothetical protein